MKKALVCAALFLALQAALGQKTSPAQKPRAVPPPTLLANGPGIEFICRPSLERNQLAFLAANGERLGALYKRVTSDPTHFSKTSAESSMLEQAQEARVLDRAVDFCELFKISKTENFAPAYEQWREDVERVCVQDWQRMSISDANVVGLQRIEWARDIDTAKALRAADSRIFTGEVAAAYKEHAAHLDSLAQRTWHDSPVDSEQKAVRDIQQGYQVELARALQKWQEHQSDPAFARVFAEEEQRLNDLATSTFASRGAAGEEAAVCRVWRVYLDSHPASPARAGLRAAIPPPPPAKAPAREVVAPVKAENPPEARALFSKVLGTFGDEARLKDITSFKWTVSRSWKIPGGEIAFTTELLAVFPDQLYMKISSQLAESTMVISPQATFMAAAGMGARDVPSSLRDENMREFKQEPLYIVTHAADPAIKLALGGNAKLGEINAQVLEINCQGYPVRWLVDPASGRLLATRIQEVTPTGPVEFTIEYSDWRPVQGINYPFTHRQLRNGQEMATSQLTSLQLNPAVDPKLFEKPPQP